MKKAIRYVALVTLTGLVLLVNSGVSLSMMACNMSGHVEIALGEVTDPCCDGTNQETTIGTDCCDGELFDFASGKYFPQKEVHKIFAGVTPSPIIVPFQVAEAKANAAILDRGPPINRQNLHLLFEQFLI